MPPTQGGVIMDLDLFTLRRRLEILKGEEVPWAVIAEGAGLHPNTVYDLAENRSKRVAIDTLNKLLNYFREQGLDVGPGDLWIMKSAPMEA